MYNKKINLQLNHTGYFAKLHEKITKSKLLIDFK